MHCWELGRMLGLPGLILHLIIQGMKPEQVELWQCGNRSLGLLDSLLHHTDFHKEVKNIRTVSFTIIQVRIEYYIWICQT